MPRQALDSTDYTQKRFFAPTAFAHSSPNIRTLTASAPASTIAVRRSWRRAITQPRQNPAFTTLLAQRKIFMELNGNHQFKAPLTKVWDALLDPTVLSKALPGGDQLVKVGENDYKAAMNVKVGPVQGRFEGQVTLSDINELESYHMKVTGTGAPGFLNGEGTLKLSENEEGTLLTYSGDVQIGGRIATVGQRLVDSTARSIIRQGLKALDEQLANGSPALEPEGVNVEEATPNEPGTVVDNSVDANRSATSTSRAASAAEPPSPAMGKIALDVVKDVAQDLASDLVPREKQPQVFSFILGALAMLAFVVLVRLVQRD
jgi:carbon monoxide dehydrogenase subunit G